MANNQTIRVAAAQIDPVLKDVKANLDKHLEWIERARAEGVELLVFPELSLSGYDVRDAAIDIAISVMDPLDDPTLVQIAEAAGDMYVVVGFVEEGFGAQIFNAAGVFHRGEQVFVHRKLNLANYGDMQEAKFFAAGRYMEPYELPKNFTGAILCCSDSWNPALVHIAALHGATMLTIPTNSSLDAESGDVSKPERWDTVLSFYATLYGLPVVFCNRVGREGVHTFWGGSRILDAHGNQIARAGADGEELIVAEIAQRDVREARFRLPTVRDSNLSLIHREIDRLAQRVGVPKVVRKT
ncbi:MAG: nitrilase-related carbon-nitrogen hydrolase [Deltaproteobacteria bacterium]